MKEVQKILGWLPEITQSYEAGTAHQFVLHGNVDDYFVHPSPHSSKQYYSLQELLRELFPTCDAVVSYNIGSGLVFGSEDVESRFRQLTGFGVTNEDDPIARARRARNADKLPTDPTECLDLLGVFLKEAPAGSALVIVDGLEKIAPYTPGNQFDRVNTAKLENWAKDRVIAEARSIIVLLAQSSHEVSPSLLQATGVCQTRIPLPHARERRNFLRKITKQTTQHVDPKTPAILLDQRTNWDAVASFAPSVARPDHSGAPQREAGWVVYDVPAGFDVHGFSRATQGLSLRQILNVFNQNNASGSQITLEVAREAKQKILSRDYGDLLDIIEPSIGFADMAGVDHIIAYFSEVLQAMRQGEVQLVPAGVVLLGPPGTGKTTIASALAKEGDFNCIKLKSIRSKWVGESEGRLDAALNVLMSLAPVVLIMDEADQEGSARGADNDHPVDARLRAMLMQFQSNPAIRGQVLTVACTNRPDLMDDAVLRSGRFDTKIPVVMPGVQERQALFAVMLRRQGVSTDVADFRPIAESASNFSGADIEVAVREAHRLAFNAGRRSVTSADLAEAVGGMSPSVSQEVVDEQTLLAFEHCSPRRLLPPDWEETVMQINKRGLARQR
ncbi:MAG: ATP-binding protein [Candidatus Binatia bacterium]